MAHHHREHERKSDTATQRPISAGRGVAPGTASTPSARQNLGVDEHRPVEGQPVLRVGCPMWAHAPWVGRFLSPANRGNELVEYSGWCNAVEGNTTFYATPRATTIERWAKQAPVDFRFAFKVPRTITHELRLHGYAARELTVFLQAIEPLGERVGPIQLQLPPSFGPDQLSTLRAFVDPIAVVAPVGRRVAPSGVLRSRRCPPRRRRAAHRRRHRAGRARHAAAVRGTGQHRCRCRRATHEAESCRSSPT